jgi:hypothetical protein
MTAPNSNPRQQGDSDLYVEDFLYDLQADPYELTNMIGWESHREVAAVLRERLIKRMVQAGEKAPRVELSPVKKSGQRRVTTAEAHS